MTRKERRRRDGLGRVADWILVYARRPVPALCLATLRDIYQTIREASVAVLEKRPIPPEALAAAAQDDRPTIVVGVHGGGVQWVQKSNPDVRVIVRDYDVDGADEERLHRGDDGALYAEWEQ